MSPLRNREVEFCFWQVDEHSSDLRSFLLTHDFLHVLVDDVTDDLFLLSSISALEFVGNEHLLDLRVVYLGILQVHELWSARGSKR